jgi:hypothetical protein
MLPEEILCSMFEWLETNHETTALAITCKTWWHLAKSNGYIRKLRLDPHTDGNEWIQRFNNNVHTIDRVFVDRQTDPHYWIFRFPRVVNCSECELTGDFIPNGGKPCKTEMLILRNMLTSTARTTFKTNWALFPKLKRLVLYVAECDITGLEKLKHLDTTYIRTDRGTLTRDGTEGPS